MGFDMGAIQHNLFGWLGRRRDRLEYLLPNSALAPAGETIVDRLGGAVFLWAVDPAAAHFEHVHDPAQNPPIILTPRPRLNLGQMRFDLRPLLIVKPKQMRGHRLVPKSVD